MKRFNRLFQEAERLAPPPDLWKRIEARTALVRQGRPDAAGFRAAPAMRAAAAVVLAVGVLGLGLMLQKRAGDGDGAAYAVSSYAAQDGAQAMAGPDADMVDAELLGWHADLGDDLGGNPGDDFGETGNDLADALDAGNMGMAAEAEEML